MDKPDYDEIIDKLKWYIETREAMVVVRVLVQKGKTKIGAYRRLAIMAGGAECDLRDLLKQEKHETNQSLQSTTEEAACLHCGDPDCHWLLHGAGC